jgi:hypothetical protein
LLVEMLFCMNVIISQELSIDIQTGLDEHCGRIVEFSADGIIIMGKEKRNLFRDEPKSHFMASTIRSSDMQVRDAEGCAKGSHCSCSDLFWILAASRQYLLPGHGYRQCA